MDTNMDDKVTLADIKKFCEKHYMNFEDNVYLN